MKYQTDKKEYVRPVVMATLLNHEIRLLNASSELGKDIFIDEEEEGKNDVIFG